MAHNFKTDTFSGSLLDLFELCWEEMLDAKTHLTAHRFLITQPTIHQNILPLRKFAPDYSERGKLWAIENFQFLPVDNEPLAFLYKTWKSGGVANKTLGDMLRGREIPASWSCDARDGSGMRFSGVSTPFRDHGLKLAHLSDAAIGIDPSLSTRSIILRFMRSLSPLNVFLFPNFRQVEFKLLRSSENWKPTRADWAEDRWLRSVALSWLMDKLVSANSSELTQIMADFGPGLSPNPNWRQAAAKTEITVTPRVLLTRMQYCAEALITRPDSTARSDAARPKNTATKPLEVDEAVELLRVWRQDHPEATQLDGGTKSNPSEWMHIRVEGYSSPRDDFQSCHGPVIRGHEYNGVVNFHGDAKTDAIDRFITLIDEAESYRDVLRPSATFKNQTLRTGSSVKPKFALHGYSDSVEGFYLYHSK